MVGRIMAEDFQDEWNFETNAVNLTEPWTFPWKFDHRAICTLRYRTGIDGTPMPWITPGLGENKGKCGTCKLYCFHRAQADMENE